MSPRRGVALALGRNLAIALVVGAVSGSAARPHVAQDVATREIDVAAPEAALAVLQRQASVARAIAAGGGKRGIFLALHVARRNTQVIGAVLALAGPTDGESKPFIAARGAPPVLGGASGNDAPAPPWIRELVGRSRHPLSRAVVYREAGHGTEMLAGEAAAVPLIVDWFRRALHDEQSPRRCA